MTGIVKLDEIQNNAGTTTLAKLENGVLTGALSPTGFRNRIINGDMRIDQRNAGASVTPTDGIYTLDRCLARVSQASKYTVQQNAGSVTPPTGFKNYLGVTSSSAYSVLTGDYFALEQRIEGFNTADLDWGTANAQTVTLSFWVRSSLTGTFGGALGNSAFARGYPFTYTISTSNTWEYKTVTIVGDTTGTWLTDNGTGVRVSFGLGVGSTYSGTAGAWAGAGYFSATGATSVVGTSGATFYITGVQLEKGTVATPFEFRSIGQELALCQRYYYRLIQNDYSTTGYSVNAASFRASGNYPVTMRTAPTSLEQSGTASHYTVVGGGRSSAVCSAVPAFLGSGQNTWQATCTVASGLVAYNAGIVNINTNGYLGWSAEL